MCPSAIYYYISTLHCIRHKGPGPDMEQFDVYVLHAWQQFRFSGVFLAAF